MTSILEPMTETANSTQPLPVTISPGAEPSPRSVTGIAETSLYVNDLPRAVEFYTGLFGWPVLFRDARVCALRVAEGQVLLLFRRGGSLRPTRMAGGEVPPHNGAGPLHVCFGIPRDAVTFWEAQLERVGMPIESRMDWPTGGISLYFRDPDGHAVELATPGIWG